MARERCFQELMSPEQLKAWKEKPPRSDFKPSILETYRTDAVLVRSYTPACAGTVSKGAKILNKPSRRSLNRLVFLLNNCDIPMRSMLTITIQKDVEQKNSVEFHIATLKAALQKLRRDGCGQYVWVREYQEKYKTVHWHIFTDMVVGDVGGEVNTLLSRSWSSWMVNRYEKAWCPAKHAQHMRFGDGKEFKGCCRFEVLHGEAGGQYAGKEGSKRHQKEPPERWKGAGAWWRGSRGITCTPTGTKKVNGARLEAATVKIKGEEFEVPYRVQFNRGQPPS